MKKTIGIFFCAYVLLGCNGKSDFSERERVLNTRIQELEHLVNKPLLEKGNIQHTVQFSLKYAPEAPESRKFMEDGTRILSALPMVRDFNALRQVSMKDNKYTFYFTMIFDNQEAYDAYNTHPDHETFVKERWEKEVTDFLEADFIVF